MTRPRATSPLPGSSLLLKNSSEFRTALLDWYRRHHRRLPWRETQSLYRTVVSEMMLQQTRIDTALPYFDRWMKALPDFETLAAASEDEVLKLWEGLGYYRRVRNLHRLAREIVAIEKIPETPEAWQTFPGIGPYSAAAITSIAFHAPAACVDGNVVRVLARLIGHAAPLKDTSSAARLFQPLAQELVNPSDPGSHNQAMMELGATVCQPNPVCGRCPVAVHCQAHRDGTAAAIPHFPPRAMEKRSVSRIWAERDGNLLLSKTSGDSRRLADLYELPSFEQVGLSSTDAARTGKLLLKKTRSITRFTITESIFAVDANFLPTQLGNGLSWFSLDSLDRLTFSGPHRRWIDSLLASPVTHNTAACKR